jgi:uncharacterized protein YndB with AHSA1/START domain
MTDAPAIRLERRVSARPSAVYAYLTESGAWARWQGVAATVEPVPGGAFEMQMPHGDVAQGQFLELVPNARVVFSWGWRGSGELPPGSSIVEIDLLPDGDGTLIVLSHRGLPPGIVPPHEAGWRHYLQRLAAVSEGADPGVDPGPGPP